MLGFRVSVFSSTGLPNLCARRLFVSSYCVVSGSEDEVDEDEDEDEAGWG